MPRARKIDPERASKLREQGMSYRQIGAYFGASGVAAFKALNKGRTPQPRRLRVAYALGNGAAVTR